MKRTDIIMTDSLKQFLSFDLGQMNEDKFTNKLTNISYSTNSDLKLDIYFPEQKKENRPVILVVYGGGWASGFKTDKFVEPMLKPLQYGYVCVVADYTLSLDGMYPQAVIDLKNALGWIQDHAVQYHLDCDDITIWGESAGAHLALEAGLLPNDLFHLQYPTMPRVKNIVAFYPLVDFTQANQQAIENGNPNDMGGPESMFGLFLGTGYHDEKIRWMCNPTHYISETMPRLFLQHGKNDALVPYQQSVNLIQAIDQLEKSPDYYFEIVEGKIHTDPYFFTDENVGKMINFLEK